MFTFFAIVAQKSADADIVQLAVALRRTSRKRAIIGAPCWIVAAFLATIPATIVQAVFVAVGSMARVGAEWNDID
jgi:hypothetical protein